MLDVIDVQDRAVPANDRASRHASSPVSSAIAAPRQFLELLAR